MTTTVIVVCHKPGPWLGPSVASVTAQADEVVLVDNGSSGGAVGEVGRAAGARVLRAGRNLGFAPAVNLGLEVATGDVIGLLNDDAMAGEGWLASAARVLEDESIAAVAPKLLLAAPFAEVVLDDEIRYFPPDPRPMGRCLYRVDVCGRDVLAGLLGAGIHRMESGEQWGEVRQWRWTSGPLPIYVPLADRTEAANVVIDGQPVTPRRVVDLINNAGSYLSTEGHGGDFGYESPDDGRFDIPAERFGACGAAMVMRADTIERVGRFAARFFAYYEDIDWCWRARLAGYRVWYDPSAVVRHVRGATSGGPTQPKVRFLAQRNRMDTLARNAPLRVFVEQARRLREPHQPRDLLRATLPRVPRALGERACLARRWRRSPGHVWSEWAGRDESWSSQEQQHPAGTYSPERRDHPPAG